MQVGRVVKLETLSYIMSFKKGIKSIFARHSFYLTHLLKLSCKLLYFDDKNALYNDTHM